MNLVGLDPRLVLLEQQAKGAKFNLVEFVRSRPELCRVLVRDANFGFVKRYPMLVTANPTAQKEGVTGYEIVLDYNGVPIQLIPRAASEFKSKTRYQVLSVNTAEQQRNRCRQLVVRRGNGWDLSSRGADLLNIITE